MQQVNRNMRGLVTHDLAKQLRVLGLEKRGVDMDSTGCGLAAAEGTT